MPGGADQPRASWTPGRSGRSSAAPRAWPTCSCRRTASSGDRSPRTSATTSGRPGRARRRRAGRLRLLRRRAGQVDARAARCGSTRDRSPRRPHRRVRVEPPLGGRRPAVRARLGRHRCRGRRRRLGVVDGGAPRVHVAEGSRHVRRRPRQRAGLGVRHRLQRQRDRRRLDPYPSRGRPEARLRDHGARRGGGAGEVRLPPRRRSTTSHPTSRSRTRDPHPRRRKPARREHRRPGHPRRVGGASARPRWRRVHRPA